MKIWLKVTLIGLGVVAAVGAWFLVNSLKLGEVGEEITERVERSNKDLFWNRYVTVEQVDVEFEPWPATLQCDPWHKWEGFTREKTLLVGDGVVAYDNGDVKTFVEATEGGMVVPGQMEARFEWWRGDRRGQQFVMRGWYTAGNDRVKELTMKGELTDKYLRVEGKRGPRKCVIEARAPEESAEE